MVFDTFYDRRNGVAFMVNPLGGFFDYEITDEGNPNQDWNPIWFLRQPFALTPTVTIPVGGSEYRDFFVAYAMGEQRRVSGTWSVQKGEYLDGHITAVSYQRPRIELTPQLSGQPGLSINRIELPAATVTLKLVTSRVIYTMTPRMFVSGLIQYNSNTSSLSANLRLRWEYRPGSELFVVYDDQRDTSQRGTALLTRAFVVKLTRQFRL